MRVSPQTILALLVAALLVAGCTAAPGPGAPTALPSPAPPTRPPALTATPPVTTGDAERAATATALAATEIAALMDAATEVFREPFDDNRNAWFTGVFQEVETNVIEEGVLKVRWAGKGSSYELYEPRDVRDFIAAVDCQLYRGGPDGSCGLIFAQRRDAGFYKFELFENYYRLYRVPSAGEPLLLVEGDPAGVIRPSAMNRLQVIRQGASIRLLVNDTLLARVEDAALGAGKVGVATDSYAPNGGVEVWLDNFVIWEGH
ncbi:MAG: hypothetical protein N2378_08985 [Chloroflexaceae bacterium]|nr:hypothetical protein [Chloroflexaceae bacterium]